MDLITAVKRIEAGDKVRIFHDFYGQQWLHLSRGWKLWRPSTMRLRSVDRAHVEAALRRRREAREARQTVMA